ncbi:MAG: prepilin-type N-terminal cleavage/methylation domain-containing protein [Synergistaceae bacterium]|nr:prepilin-type N-terminal cleavage/methylation domain-containing protein [Synergistaceae bacterium]
MRKRIGFTLVEVMVAVMVLASVATAAIKLVILAQNTLAATKDKEELINAAQEIEAGISAEDLKESGSSGDFRWETEEKETEMFGEDFGRLDFDSEAPDDSGEPIEVRWREITVTNAKNQRLTLYIPSKESAVKDRARSVSGDRREERRE